jgi:hypothetical protein
MQSEKLALTCERILVAAEDIARHRKDHEHEAFLKLWEETTSGKRLIAEPFDDVRRSNAVFKLMAWRRNGLLSDAEVAQFSEGTQQLLRLE